MTGRASTLLMYGKKGAKKTTQLGFLARWLWKRTGKITRLISADQEWDTIKTVIAEGIIQPFSIQNIPHPWEVTLKLSQGMWPKGVRGDDGKPRIELQETADWSKIGAYAVEGLDSIGELLLGDHMRTGRKLAQEPPFRFQDGDMTFSGAAPAHYGDVQNNVILTLVPNFARLPVEWIWWTGHELLGVDEEGTKRPVFGPGVVGKKSLKVNTKIGSTFHMESMTVMAPHPKNPEQKIPHTAFVAWFRDHPDDLLPSMLWPANFKMPVEWVRAWQQKFPYGFIPLTLEGGAEQYLQFLIEQEEAHAAALSATEKAAQTT
jgi:hypothetical protein